MIGWSGLINEEGHRNWPPTTVTEVKETKEIKLISEKERRRRKVRAEEGEERGSPPPPPPPHPAPPPPPSTSNCVTKRFVCFEEKRSKLGGPVGTRQGTGCGSRKREGAWETTRWEGVGGYRSWVREESNINTDNGGETQGSGRRMTPHPMYPGIE
ncbi:hypothetical protein DPEC_G00200040 [Dallia pectoralis]|uniref:Uncharacterized protein n=1 Tax=Dallia pectoralis TaxID=75939 RepID=A0ACC2G8R7_DALPE|nr:hypothetical protein DPEC_G00200040 [Dallia pectoralis]